MYLPSEISDAKVLITVKTYPRPTSKREEIVCTAGILENGKWVRIYPVPFRDLPFEKQYKKYQWIKLNLRKSRSDTRLDSYEPKAMYDEQIELLEFIDTNNGWHERKRLVLQNVYSSLNEIVSLAYDKNLSLVTFKPKKILDFIIEKEDSREWDSKHQIKLNQMKLFESNNKEIIRKLPYKYYFKFETEDNKESKLMIQDWEIGALYWNCLKDAEGNETVANNKVRHKYLTDFAGTKDIHFFLGTTYRFHKQRSLNPFHIIGVFPPPITSQLPMDL
jgi:hypothetical protein